MLYHQCASESVTEGHPDKICGSILDALPEKGQGARVAVETLVTLWSWPMCEA